MKHLKLFETINEYNNWLTSDNYVIPHIIKDKELKKVSYQKKILYDSELEYIECTGTQYIDTEIIPNNTTFSIETCIAITLGGQNSTILGSVDGNTLSRYYPLGYHKGAYVCNFDGSWNDNYKATTTALNVNSFYDIYTSINNNSATIQCSNVTKIVNYVSGINNKSLYLFCRNGDTPQNFAQCKMKYMKIYQDNKLISYLIPVRRNNIGYIYDRVRNRLFENNGTGQFVLGPDI